MHSFFVARLTIVNCSISDVTFVTVSCIHTVVKKTVKGVLHCDMCSINLFNVLLYISAGLRKFPCFFGQQGYTYTRQFPYTFSQYPLARYLATKHMASYVSSYVSFARYMEIYMYPSCHMFRCKVIGNFHVPCHMFHRKVHGNCKVHGNFHVPCNETYGKVH